MISLLLKELADINNKFVNLVEELVKVLVLMAKNWCNLTSMEHKELQEVLKAITLLSKEVIKPKNSKV